MAADRSAQSDAGERMRVCPGCGTKYVPGTRFCASDGQVLRDEGSENDWLIGKLIADRYLVEKQLGAGGMGVVYLAQHVYMPRRCAIKVLRPEFLSNTEAVGRFAREAQNASRISHPNIAAVYDFGDASGELMYLAMEFVEGMSLAKVLESGGLTTARVATVLSQVASALKAAHELGIVHRDLKPDNIMLAISGESTDLVKVVDFGIARAVLETGQQVTSSGVAIGTPAYMSPEQMSGATVDARSDLYSLALVVYVMLTGALPYGHERADLPLRYVDPPKPLRDLAPKIHWPESLQAVLNRALSANPDDRQETVQTFAREVINALRSWQPDEIAASLNTLTSLGADVTSALPPDLLMRWATPPVEHQALSPTGRRPMSAQRKMLLGAGATLLIGGSAYAVSAGRGNDALSKVPPTVVESTKTSSPLEPAPPPSGSPAVAPNATTSPPRRTVQGAPRQVTPPRPRDTTSVAPDASSALPTTGTTPANRDSAPGTRLADSAGTPPPTATLPAPPVSTEPPRPVPKTGFVYLGAPPNVAAILTANDRLMGVLRRPSYMEFAPGMLTLRLSLEGCTPWDSVVRVVAGDTIRIGSRRPTCPP